HVGGVRWWNVKHPAAYADRIHAGVSPAHGRETLSDEDRRVERVMLELRLQEGMRLDALDEDGRAAVPEQVERGLVTVSGDRIVLTDAGRLLADGVVRDLLV
ncbi:MAG: radical SAM family heme chaperone HemW, partial [Nocardioides sp.]